MVAEDANTLPGTRLTVCVNASLAAEAVGSKSTNVDTTALPAEYLVMLTREVATPALVATAEMYSERNWDSKAASLSSWKAVVSPPTPAPSTTTLIPLPPFRSWRRDLDVPRTFSRRCWSYVSTSKLRSPEPWWGPRWERNTSARCCSVVATAATSTARCCIGPQWRRAHRRKPDPQPAPQRRRRYGMVEGRGVF